MVPTWQRPAPPYETARTSRAYASSIFCSSRGSVAHSIRRLRMVLCSSCSGAVGGTPSTAKSFAALPPPAVLIIADAPRACGAPLSSLANPRGICLHMSSSLSSTTRRAAAGLRGRSSSELSVSDSLPLSSSSSLDVS